MAVEKMSVSFNLYVGGARITKHVSLRYVMLTTD